MLPQPPEAPKPHRRSPLARRQPGASCPDSAFSDEALEALTQGTHWHAVLVPGSGAKGSPDRTFNKIAGTAEAVIFCGAFADIASLAEALGGFKAPDAKRPRLVAVLADAPRGGDVGVLLEAQHRLRSAGADDVLLAAGEACDVRFAVALCLERLRYEDARRQQLERSIHAQLEQLRQLNEQAPSGEGLNELFWHHAHKIFATFPELVPGTAKEPSPEAKIGPCQLGQALGKGAFGEMYEALNTETRRAEVVKALPKRRLCTVTAVHRLNKELQALARLDHRNVVKLHGVLHGPHHIFLRMEAAGKYTLGQLLQEAGWGLKADVAQDYQAQLLSALSHCHARGIAHRDLKPANIAVSGCGQQLKLLAFGFAAVAGQPCYRPVGTMPFMSPEMLRMPEDKGYEPSACDVWASGVLLVLMLCPNKMAAMLEGPATLAPACRWGAELAAFFGSPGALEKALREDLGDVSEHLLLLLRGSLEVDPACRWTAAQAEACQWLSSRSKPPGSRWHFGSAAVPKPLPAMPAGPRPGGARPRLLPECARGVRCRDGEAS